MPVNQLKKFPLKEAIISFWVFKKSGLSDNPVYTGHWIDISSELEAALKLTVVGEINRITEVQKYSILSEVNESSALLIGALETHADKIVNGTAVQSDRKKFVK